MMIMTFIFDYCDDHDNCPFKPLIRFVMRLSDSSWHEDCLFCSQVSEIVANAVLRGIYMGQFHQDGENDCFGFYLEILEPRVTKPDVLDFYQPILVEYTYWAPVLMLNKTMPTMIVNTMSNI